MFGRRSQPTLPSGGNHCASKKTSGNAQHRSGGRSNRTTTQCTTTLSAPSSPTLLTDHTQTIRAGERTSRATQRQIRCNPTTTQRTKTLSSPAAYRVRSRVPITPVDTHIGRVVECRFVSLPAEDITIDVAVGTIINRRWLSTYLCPRLRMELAYQPELIFLKSINGGTSPMSQSFETMKDEFVVPPTINSVEFIWRCTITASNKDKKIVLQCEYLSDMRDGFETLVADMKTCFPPGSIMLTNDYLPLDAAHFYNHPSTEFHINVIDGHDNYNNLCLHQVWNFLEFSLPPGRQLRPGVKSGDSNLNMMIQGVSGDVLDQRSALWLESIQQANRLDEWNLLVQCTTDRLTQLHQAFTPSNRLVEQARRLIIDQILISVCFFRGITFSVEVPMKCTVEERKSDEKIEKIGWGKLDYILGNLTVKVALESDEEESLNVESLKISEESKDEVSVGSIDVEAKELCDDRGLAQISAQLFDLMKSIKSTSIRGLLCTGTHWRFFTLSSREESPKPLLQYEGQKLLQIMKLPPTAEEGSNRRRSAQNKEFVSVDQVRSAMAAVAASI